MASEHDLDGDHLETIFDFVGVEGAPQHTIDNQFQLSVLVGNKGDKIGRRSLSVLNADFMDHHPESNKLIKSLHCWFWLSGGIKVFTDFRGQEITLADKRVYLTLSPGHPEVENIAEVYPPPEVLPEHIMGLPYESVDDSGNILGVSDETLNTIEETWGKMYYKDQVIPEWTRSVMEYEWKVDHSYIEAIEDNTLMICFLPLQSRWKAGWEVEQLILNPGETKPTDKQGELCYLFATDDCEVIDSGNGTPNITHYFKQWDCKKLTKEHYLVKNTNNERIKLIRFYKK